MIRPDAKVEKVYLYPKPVDFRKSIDGLSTIARYSHRLEKRKACRAKSPAPSRDRWAIRVRLHLAEKIRDLALFNLAIDSKLRACDLTKLRVRDIAPWEAYFVARHRDAAEKSSPCTICNH